MDWPTQTFMTLTINLALILQVEKDSFRDDVLDGTTAFEGIAATPAEPYALPI